MSNRPAALLFLFLVLVLGSNHWTPLARAEPPRVYDPFDPYFEGVDPPVQTGGPALQLNQTKPFANPEDELARQWDSTQVPLGKTFIGPSLPRPNQNLHPEGMLAERWLQKFNELHSKPDTPPGRRQPAHLYRVTSPSHWAKAKGRFMFAHVPTQFGPAVRENGAFELRGDLGSLAIIGTAPEIRTYFHVGNDLKLRNVSQPRETDAISFRIAEFKAKEIDWLDPWGMTIEMVALDFASMVEPDIPYLIASPPIIADAVPGFRQAKIFNKCELRKKPGVVRFFVGIVKFLTWIKDDKSACLDERHFGVFFNIGSDGTKLPSSGPGKEITLGDAGTQVLSALRREESTRT